MLVSLGLLTLLEYLLVRSRLGGAFSYTLDDPYIHLALADQIAQGHYGLNPGEAAAPSSSIVYPFLLAGLSIFGFGEFGPLVVGVVATAASGLLLCAIVRDAAPGLRWPFLPAAGLAVSFSLSLNLIGLQFTGLEHSLHVAVTLACVLGAIRFLRDGTVAPWWWLCAFAEPAIRFEGASVWFATVGLLLCGGRFAAGFALLAAGAALLGGFSLFLHRLGLPLLPSSVLVKSTVTLGDASPWAAGLVGQVLEAVRMNLSSYGGARLALFGVLLVLAAALRLDGEPRRHRARLQLACFALFVSAAHGVLGRFGWLCRYEIYVLALDACVLVWSFGPSIASGLRYATPARVVIAALLPMALMSVYVQTSLRSFAAAGDVHGQHFQLHRFAADFYAAPVAVNDLGWVSYRNPHYVLDLWGLGSEEARAARAGDPSGRWMDDLARRHDVGLAMIYTSWFERLPAGWRAVARLSLEQPSFAADEAAVTFYATRPDRDGRLGHSLARFGRSLPPGTRLDILEPS